MATVRQVIVSVLAALLAGVGAATPVPSDRSTDPAAAGLVVEAFDVEQVPALSPGTELRFSLFGTPDAEASLQIDGARRSLDLQEVQPGIYEGIYTIAADDRIGPQGQVTATLRRGHQVARTVLDEALLLGAQASPPAGPPVLAGTPADEPAPVRRSPRIGTPVPAAPALPAAPGCDDCAVVESIRAVDLGEQGGFLGALTGGLFGAILGNQVGDGDGRRLARIVGALGGALAGRELERSGSRRTRWDVVLRLPSGAAQTRSYDRAPPFRVGDTVRVGGDPPAHAPRSAAPF